MRCVPIKTVEQQGILSVHRARQGFVQARTAQGNQIRGLLSEFGIVIPKGINAIFKRVPEILEDAEREVEGRGAFAASRSNDGLGLYAQQSNCSTHQRYDYTKEHHHMRSVYCVPATIRKPVNGFCSIEASSIRQAISI